MWNSYADVLILVSNPAPFPNTEYVKGPASGTSAGLPVCQLNEFLYDVNEDVVGDLLAETLVRQGEVDGSIVPVVD